MTKLHLNTRQRNELARLFLAAIEFLGPRAWVHHRSYSYQKQQNPTLCGALFLAYHAGHSNHPTQKRASDLISERLDRHIRVDEWLRERGYALGATEEELIEYRKRWAQALHDEFIVTEKGRKKCR